MEIWTRVPAMRFLVFSVALLLVGSARADDWTAGRDLFASTGKANCAQCHSTSAHAGATASQIDTAINGPGGIGSMNIARLTSLTATEINQIAIYLSTPKHATLTPSSDSFGVVPIGLTPKPTLTYSLASDGDSTRAGSDITPGSISAVDPLGFNFTSCSASPLAVGSSCNVVVQFTLSQINSFSTAFSVTFTGGQSTSANVSGTVVANLEITTAGTLSFNTVFATPANPPDSQSVTIANPLNGALRMCVTADPGATGTSTFIAGEFDLVGHPLQGTPPSCATVAVPPASPLTQSITFAPTSDGPRLAKFTVERADGAGGWTDLQSIGLEGNAGPRAIFSGALLKGTGTGMSLFEGTPQDINLGGLPTTLTLKNAGSHGLKVVSVSVSLVAGETVKEYATSGCASVTLLSGQTCDMTVTFDPLKVGQRDSQLSIGYVDSTLPASPAPPVQTATLALRGRGLVGPELEVRDGVLNSIVPSAATVDFGVQNINIDYTRTFVLKNIGTDEALLLSAASITPTGARFSLTAPKAGATAVPSCSALIAGNTQRLAPLGSTDGSCAVDIRFSPVQVTSSVGQLAVATRPETSGTPPPGTFQLALKGTGANDIPVLQWRDLSGNPLATVAFPLPATAVGSASPPSIRIRLANGGKGAAVLNLLNLVGADAANFAIDLSDPAACAVGSQAQAFQEGTTCDVVIRFTPQTAGSKQASLQLVSSGSTPQPVLISGQAAGPAGGVDVSVAPASIDFTQVRVGAESAPVSVTISNNGSFPARVTSIEADQPFAVLATTCAGMSFTLAPNASCTMAVRFLPTVDGQMAGALRVVVDGRATPAASSLRGDGVKAADLSSGGCSLSEGRSIADPTLWVLALLAVVGLLYRRVQRPRTRFRAASDRDAR